MYGKRLFLNLIVTYKLIDFTHAGTGMYKGTVNGRWHDHANYNEVSTFTNVVSSTSGAVNVKEQNLDNNKNKTGANARLEIPIDLVLKDGKTVDNLVGQPHIQMRITNDDYSEVFCVAGTGKASSDPTNNDDSAVDPDTLITPYNSYTFMTYVPSKNNNADVNTVSDFDMDYQFYSANSYAKYNEEGGYIDVFHKQSKMNSADNIGGESFAFRQVFNEKFAEVLKPQDESGTVAEVFTASQQGDKWGTTKPIYITKAQLNTSKNSDLNPGFTGIQVASTYKNNTIGQKFAGLNTVLTTEKPQDSFLNSATTEFNSGLPTITRYYIDKDKVAEKGLKKDDLASFDFYSTFILDGTKKFIEYTATNDTGADIVLAPNSVLGLTYADNKTSTPNTDLEKYSLTFGDDAYKIELRSNFTHVGGPAGQPGRGREYEYKLIPGMTIKAGEKITFRTMKYNTPPTSVTLTLPGKDGAKKIVLKPGENGPEVNTPRRLNYITTYAGGSATQSGLNPDIDELFTDSENITGRTRYELAVIKLFYPDGSEYPFTIADQDTRTKMNVNGAELDGFTFTTEGKTGFTMPAVVKDSVIGITNTDVRKAAVPSEKVEEKVQAKVTFDLNGGKLPTETKSFEGFDEKALPGTEFAYKLERAKETDPVVRIAPMNKLAASDADYTPNGFKVEKYIDHNGDELKGDALELRKIVSEEPTKESENQSEKVVFLGWTTKKLEGTPEEVSTAFKALQEATTADQVNGDKNFIFTATSPLTKETTVYAAYGVEDTTAPGKPEVKAEDNGSVEITPPADDDTKSVDVTYTPEGEKEPKTVTVTKGDDGNWTLPEGAPEGITVDENTGKVTIPADKVADGTEVKATAKDDSNNESEEATAKAGNNPTTPETCLTQDGLKQQFEDAIDPMFDGIKKKDGVYEGTYDKTNKTVTVKILDKTKPFSELKGTGLIAGLTKLYNEDNLVKVQVGSQVERDLVSIYEASGNDTAFMQNIAQIVGLDIGNEVNGQGNNVNTLADFIGKTVTLKLTVAQENCGTTPVELTYVIKGIDGTDETAPAAPEVKAENNGSVTVTPPADEDTKSVDVTYTPEGETEPKTVTVTKGEDGKWTLPEDAPEGITVDENTGKVTIPADKVADGTEVKATAKDDSNNESEEATATAGNNPTTPDTTAPGKPTVDAKEDGSVEITPPADDDTKSVDVTYTPEGEKEPKTVTATKGDDGKWTLPEDAPEGITVDENTGKVTIPADKVADGTEVKAKAKDDSNNESEEASATSGNNPTTPGTQTDAEKTQLKILTRLKLKIRTI